MNRPQLIKKMTEAGMAMSKIEVRGAGRSLEVELPSRNQERIFSAKVAKWGGFTTGYGSIILRADYEADPFIGTIYSCAHY